MIWAECSKTMPNAARGVRGRVEMHNDAGGVRRADGRLPACSRILRDVRRGCGLGSEESWKLGLPHGLAVRRGM